MYKSNYQDEAPQESVHVEKKKWSVWQWTILFLVVPVGLYLLVSLTGCVAMKAIGAIADMDNGEKNKINGVVEVVRADASRPVVVYGGGYYGGYYGGGVYTSAGGYYGYGVGYDPHLAASHAHTRMLMREALEEGGR
ncbi:hypothetical protein HYZ82_03225 [Candidatus Nomurabacteria bacterium]|nr:hypothetical protein [Candidatus Nomurabacteria bacterium]